MFFGFIGCGFGTVRSLPIMASTAASTPLKLKFIFANHDGVVVEYTTESGTLIKDLKVELVELWPSGIMDGSVFCLHCAAVPKTFCAPKFG